MTTNLWVEQVNTRTFYTFQCSHLININVLLEMVSNPYNTDKHRELSIFNADAHPWSYIYCGNLGSTSICSQQNPHGNPWPNDRVQSVSTVYQANCRRPCIFHSTNSGSLFEIIITIIGSRIIRQEIKFIDSVNHWSRAIPPRPITVCGAKYPIPCLRKLYFILYDMNE